MSMIEAVCSLAFGVITWLPSPLTQKPCGMAAGSPRAWVKYDLMTLLAPGSSSTTLPPPLMATITSSLLDRVMTCDGDGPTSTLRNTAPVWRSNTVSVLPNQFVV